MTARGWSRAALVGLIVIILSGRASVVVADADAAIRLDLQECITRALAVSPDVEQAELAVSALEAKLSEATFAGILPQFQFTNILGPAPGVKGDLDSLSTIRSDLSNFGVFSRTTLDLVQPLYTFGKLDAARAAARYGLQAGEAGVVRKKSDVILQVERLYYGLLLAKALLSVVEEARDNVEKARTKVNELLEAGSEDVSENDLRKIDVVEYDVKRNLARAEKSIQMGKSALKMTLNLDRQADFDITTPMLEPVPVALSGLQVYLDRAYASRPDIRQLRAGVQVRQSLLRVARSEYFPQIALVGSLQYGVAPHRPHFSNPFLRDEFNFFRLGVLVTIRQSFSFGLSAAKHRASQAEYFELKSKEEQAMKAVALEVEQAYRDVQEAGGNVQNSERAMRAAKTWLTSTAIGFDVSGEASDLMNAFTAYSRMKQEYYQSVFTLNVAVAVLEHVTGRPASQ